MGHASNPTNAVVSEFRKSLLQIVIYEKNIIGELGGYSWFRLPRVSFVFRLKNKIPSVRFMLGPDTDLSDDIKAVVFSHLALYSEANLQPLR